MDTQELEALRAFRQQVYRTFGGRRDALFELLDAIVAAPTIETPAHLSVLRTCQRGWGSLYAALNEGTMDLSVLEQLVASYPLASAQAWYAVDASVWPRCDAETSPERGYYPHPYRHSHGQPIVAGWNYSWLVQVPSRCSSWTAPLRMRRMRPGENANVVAAEQIRSWLRQPPPSTAPPRAPPPLVTFLPRRRPPGCCAAHPSAVRGGLCPAPPRCLNRSGFGGGGRSRPTWPKSGKPTSPATRSRTASASSSRPSNGPRPNCADQRRPTAGRGCWCWLTSSCASRVTW